MEILKMIAESIIQIFLLVMFTGSVAYLFSNIIVGKENAQSDEDDDDIER